MTTNALGMALVALFSMAAVAALAQDIVDINAASREQLEGLPGIGTKIASEIVREREENGPFSALEDLERRVPSMAGAVLTKARSQLRVGAMAQVAVTDGKAVSRDVVRKVLLRFAAEPSVRDVQVQAIEYAKVHPDIVESWRTRARVSGVAPHFTAAGQGALDNDLRRVTNLDAEKSEIESQTDSNTGRLTLGVRWDLDRIIFDPREMLVAREAFRTAGQRDRVLEEVTRRYFERRRLQVDLELAPPNNLSDRIRQELRLQELTADMDALTGGWFSERLAKSGRTPN